MASKVLFVGPTLYRGRAVGLEFPLDGFTVLPPVGRGDVERLLASAPAPELIVIADGYFHLHTLAVGHAELRHALEQGIEVWGLSSMGAIRAAEMRSLGMRGFGRVYQRYVDDPRFRDDEVALLHEPDPPCRTFTEPLVHIRALLAAMVDAGAIQASRADEIVAALMPMWFGDRTAAALGQLLGLHASWVKRLDAFQLKSQDLADFLAARPWRAS